MDERHNCSVPHSSVDYSTFNKGVKYHFNARNSDNGSGTSLLFSKPSSVAFDSNTSTHAVDSRYVDSVTCNNVFDSLNNSYSVSKYSNLAVINNLGVFVHLNRCWGNSLQALSNSTNSGDGTGTSGACYGSWLDLIILGTFGIFLGGVYLKLTNEYPLGQQQSILAVAIHS